MQTLKIFSALTITLLLTACTHTSDKTPEPEEAAEENIYADMLQVESPEANATITSPVRITGEARGNWYFEASFPVKLYTEEDVLLAEGVAQAEGEWMTEDFVPFRTELAFPEQPAETTGYLVLEKANPSGLPENAATHSLPVAF